jgi:hypothetical protein
MGIGKTSRKQVDAVREQVFDRDGNRCVVDGSEWSIAYPCAGILTIQHAVTRGMGGSAKYDGIDFLRSMCVYHNTLETANADFKDACLANGWSVPRWLADTEGIHVIPVLYPDGWHLLQHGERLPIGDETAATIWSDLGF